MTIRKIVFAGLCMSLLGISARAVSATVNADVSVSPRAPCHTVKGIDSLYQASVVIVGEYHGSNEVPRFFFDVACNYERHFETGKIIVGLELSQEFEQIFQSMNSLPKAETIFAIEKSQFWSEFGDGRHSAAMLKLTLELVALAFENEGNMQLIAFQRPNIDSAGAEFILEHVLQTGAEHTLLLMGNFHARKRSFVGGPGYPPLGANLEHAGPSVLSLDIRPGSGEVWFCTTGCEKRQLRADEFPSEAGITLVPGFRGGAYDGYYYLPRLTVSDSAELSAE